MTLTDRGPGSPPLRRITRIDWQALALILAFWFSRIWQIDALPLHVDEGIHIRTALKVFEGNLLSRVSNGKIIGHWPIALLLPQNQPAFVARLATVLVVLVGFAAGYALIRRLFGRRAALLGGLMWLAAPYQMFFERTALMDAQTGALVVLSVWASLELLHRRRAWWAVLTALIMLTAILYKLTAAPVVATVGFLMLFLGKHPWRQRLRSLGIMAATLAICAAVPAIFILPRVLRSAEGAGAGLGAISTDSSLARIAANLDAFAQMLTGFGTLLWPGLLLVGLILLVLLRRRPAILLVLAPLPLLGAVVVLSSTVYYRYFAVALPLWIVLGGVGWALAADRLTAPIARRALTGVVGALLLAGIVPFALTSYRDPGDLPLPEFMRLQYLTEHSAGFGLREAALDFPHTLTRPDLPVIASMFADSCRRTNYYAPQDHPLMCGDNLGAAEIEAALESQGAVYVLADRPPYTGIDVHTLDGRATRIAGYPRPGETEASASVVLWLIERP